MRTILVTGGAGFIGSAVVREIIQHTADRVVVVDKLTYAGNLMSLAPVAQDARFAFEQVDICDRAELDRIFRQHQPDTVMHLAAESHVDRSIENPEIFLQTNVIGTSVLLDACRKYGVDRYHQVSTDEVYGDLPLDRPDLFFTETTNLHTSSPYSASKASADLLVMAYYRTYKVPVTISRCSNNYGPFHFPEKLIPLMIINALSDKKLPVYGDGLNVRDWLFVKDHCAAIDVILQKGKVGEVYNIGGHNEQKNIDVVKAICTLLEELAPNKPNGVTRYEDLITYVTDRPGHDLRYAIDASKIQKDLGWVPEESFETGLRKTVEWYLNNLEWCRRVQDGSYQRERLGMNA